MNKLKPTKTERRILAEEQASRFKWKSLVDYLRFQAAKKAATSGSRACVCGVRISANKRACFGCWNKALTEEMAAEG